MRSNLHHGLRAKPETISALIEERPTLRAVLEGYRRNPERAMNLREPLALARALADQFVFTADLNDPDTMLRAFEVQLRAATIGLQVATIESKRGPVDPAEIDRLVNAVGVTIGSFVPADQLEAASQFLRMQLMRDPDE